MSYEIKIFTDGSCLGNPGRGGFGALIYYQNRRLELWQGFSHTTNNRMEMMAVIAALSYVQKEQCTITITSDSQYLKNGITQWIHGWKKNGWKTSTGGAVKNRDLWQALDALTTGHEIKWSWVKGHAGHKDNERCDQLARDAAAGTDLLDSDEEQFTPHHRIVELEGKD